MVPIRANFGVRATHEPLVWSPAFRRSGDAEPAEAGTPNPAALCRDAATARLMVPRRGQTAKGGTRSPDLRQDLVQAGQHAFFAQHYHKMVKTRTCSGARARQANRVYQHADLHA
jgi:hypothetical protein